MNTSASEIHIAVSGALGGFHLDVAFSAPLRGITALFGASGCGKTTLLRSIAGLQRMNGRVAVGNETWQDRNTGVFLKPHERAIGYVFQEENLFPHLSVRRNLFYAAKRASRGNGIPAIGFDEVVELMGVAALLERAPLSLSGGERQRVAVARALLTQPRLMLMDEPLSALDHAAKEDVLAYFERLHRELSLPIFYVSHDIAEVARLADRMVVLSAGRNIADGPIGDVLERLDMEPAGDRYEAGVVVTARVTAQDSVYKLTRLDHHGQSIVIPFIDVKVGADVRLRIRARDVAVATQKPEGISVRNILSGVIVELRHQADTPYAEALVDIGGGRLRARLTREAAADLSLRPGLAVFALVKSMSFDGGGTQGAGAPGLP